MVNVGVCDHNNMIDPSAQRTGRWVWSGSRDGQFARRVQKPVMASKRGSSTAAREWPGCAVISFLSCDKPASSLNTPGVDDAGSQEQHFLQ